MEPTTIISISPGMFNEHGVTIFGGKSVIIPETHTMAKKDPAQKMLQLLRLYEPGTDSGRQLLEKGLADRSSLVVARAAKLAAQHQARDLLPTLAQTFRRFLEASSTADKGCEAKQALAEALCELEASEEDLYLKGLEVVQMEAAFGGPVDTAPRVRGLCAVALARCRAGGVLNQLAQVLADPEPACRVLAARAVGEYGDYQGEALLRLMLLKGEDVPDVVLEALAGIFHFSGPGALGFITRHFLQDSRAQSWSLAILALGESRLPESLELLKSEYTRQPLAADKRSVLEAIALTRLPAAKSFLLNLAAQGELPGKQAEETLRKLWDDEDILAQLNQATR